MAAVLIVSGGCLGTNGATPAPASHGPAPIRAPKPQGNLQDEAMQLYRAGLEVRVPRPWQADSFGGENLVLQAPRQGTRVNPGAVAEVQVVSTPGSPWWVPGRHRMPELVGDSLEHAQLVLHRSNVPWRVVAAPLPATRTRDVLRSYCVIAQEPAAGRTVVISDHLVWVTLAAAPCARGSASAGTAWHPAPMLPWDRPGPHPIIVAHTGGETTRSNMPPTAP